MGTKAYFLFTFSYIVILIYLKVESGLDREHSFLSDQRHENSQIICVGFQCSVPYRCCVTNTVTFNVTRFYNLKKLVSVYLSVYSFVCGIGIFHTVYLVLSNSEPLIKGDGPSNNRIFLWVSLQCVSGVGGGLKFIRIQRAI